jgi:tetratricopeptide (TPR) repeat protein
VNPAKTHRHQISLAGLTFLALVSGLLFCALPLHAARTPFLVVHFAPNSGKLLPQDRQTLVSWLKNHPLTEGQKILVLGYSDATGAKNHNYALSRRRAEAVKTEIIRSAGIAPDYIITAGKGPEDPLAPNTDANGRATNRRTELLLLGATAAKPLADSPTKPADAKKFGTLLAEAELLVKKGRMDDALALLASAKSRGADQEAHWHALYGIIGYYQAVDPDRIKPYLEKALALDPHHHDAHEYLGRVEARQLFKAGSIHSGMGRSATAPIPVATISQQYEFMQLFEVEPLRRSRLASRPIDAWECKAPNGQTVTYYFDFSSAYRRAFK